MKTKAKRYYFEALVSLLIVGLGQIIKGEGKRGLLMLLAFYFAMPALLYTALAINGYLFLLVLGGIIPAGLVLWVFNIWDALTKPC